MPTTNLQLTDRRIAALKDGRHADGLNLYIHIRGGSHTWVLRYVHAGKRREMQIGRYPELTLTDARRDALYWKRELDSGRDPLTERARIHRSEEIERRRSSETLEKLCRDYHANHKDCWRNAKHAEQWIASLENHVFPTLGSRPIGDVTAAELLALLKPINTVNHETAKRIRQRLEAVWTDAVVAGLSDINPPSTLTRLLKGPSVKRHFRSFDYRLIPAFMRQLRDSDAGFMVRLGFEFLILGCARTAEVRNAHWREIDRRNKIWRIPAELMKAGEPHDVPLTDRMLEILGAVELRTGGKGTIFSSYEGKPLSDGAFLAVLRRMNRHHETTVHGLRSSFDTWASETTQYRTDIIESALAHQEENAVRAAYNRAQYWQQRVALAQLWSDFATGKVTRTRVGEKKIGKGSSGIVMEQVEMGIVRSLGACGSGVRR